MSRFGAPDDRTAGTPTDRPNVLLIVADQMRADHLGATGAEVVRTPNLDRLAEDGVAFTRAYVANPVCMPSRATLFTGRTPRGHGVRCNGIPLDAASAHLAGAFAPGRLPHRLVRQGPPGAVRTLRRPFGPGAPQSRVAPGLGRGADRGRARALLRASRSP
ncbi:MAG: sulfatase-like hydrolase/transferase [Trueperaceae bacterium]|nr:sulfatase-like hydrolase/transferase [Trueperaceae bacterium]